MAGMMFYKNIDLLDPKKYGKSKIERISDYSFTAEANSLPVTGNEFIEASKEYIIAFLKNDEGEYFPMVVLGVAEKGQPLFQEDGTPAPLMEDVIKILQDYHGQVKHTSDFCQRLADNGLLESKEFQAEVSTKDGDKKFQLSGMYVVNEQKLLGLDDNIALDFFKKGEFAWIYSHLISLSNFPRVLDRYFAEKK
jgi:hypothetical protein